MANYINDFSHVVLAADSIRPQTITANTNGVSVDAAPVGGNSLSARLSVGAVSGTSPTLNVRMQWSADNSTWTDIAGATFTQVTAANQAEIIRFALPPAASLTAAAPRWVRAVATVGGTSPSFELVVTVLALLHHPVPAQGHQVAPPAIN